MTGRILVGTRKGTFFVEKQNGAWKPRLASHHGAGVNYVARDPNTGTLWAALGHGHWGAKLSCSVDGKEWKDAPQISYPEGAHHYVPPPPSETGEGEGAPTLKPATLLKLWVLSFGGDGKIYAGTIPGGMFVSDDGGESFELCRGLWDHESRGGDLWDGKPGSGTTKWYGTPAAEGEFTPGLHSIEVDPRDPKHLYVAISTAGVLESTDGGDSWTVRNKGLFMEYSPDPTDEWAGHDPHAIQLCANDPDHVWMQNHCGVFYSSDGAANWKKVSDTGKGVHFGFPVVADDEDGETAWLVPGLSDMRRTTVDGSLFVAKTEDGGRSWRQLREGLPQDAAYDVVYRHAFHKEGDVLAFGTTTGNLYVSEDRGESWVAAGNNLPPVYSVRFG